MASSIRFADTAGRPDAARKALAAELRPGADQRSASMKAKRQAEREAKGQAEEEAKRKLKRMWQGAQRKTTPPQLSWEERLEAKRSDPQYLDVVLGQWERGLWRRDYMRRRDQLVPLETVLANLEEREEKLRMTDDDARLTKEEEEVAELEDSADRKAVLLQLQKRLYGKNAQGCAFELYQQSAEEVV